MEDFTFRWETYLRNYEKKFIFTALKICSSLKIDVPQEELKGFFLNLYHQTFFSKDLDLSGCVDFIKRLKERGVDLKFVATKAFLLTIGEFAIQCFHKEDSIEPVKEMVERIDRVLNACSEKVAEKEEEDLISYVRKLISHREKAVDFSDVDPESEENRRILEEFRELYKKGESLELFNIYKGLHIKSTARIVRIDKDGVVLEVSPTQLGAIAIDWYTLIKHPRWSRGIYGEVKRVDPENKRVKLWRFKRSEGKEEKRASVRVKPKDVVEVSIKSEGGVDLTGYMLDISIDHVNVFIPKGNLPFTEDKDLKLSFQLENCREGRSMDLELKGTVVGIRPIPRGKSVVFRLHTSTRDESKLSIYLTCRQKEIVRDINDYVKEYLS